MKLAPVNEIMERIGILACGITVIVILLLLVWFVEWVLNMMSFKREVEFDISAIQEKCKHQDHSLVEIKDKLEEIKYHLDNRKDTQNEALNYETLYLLAKEKADNWDRARWIIDKEGRLFYKNEEGEMVATFNENTWVSIEAPKTDIYCGTQKILD